MKKRVLFLIAFLLWSFFQSFASQYGYWRDSSEFILAAFSLDIAHPAGFPLYSQLANAFSLLPFGSIPWRVNLFSSLCASLFLLMGGVIIFLLARNELKAKMHESVLVSLLPVVFLPGMDGFVRQAASAEVYLLNGVLLEILFLLYYFWLKRQDLRFLITAGFVGGAALGNHLSALLAYIPVVAVVFFDFNTTKKAIPPAFAAGVLGIMIYGFIPVRAANNLPLNTGGAYSPRRFWSHVSDERDRKLRAYNFKDGRGKEDDNSSQFIRIVKEKLGYVWQYDLLKLKKEAGIFLLVLSAAGFLMLMIRNWRIGLAAGSIGAGNWLFFSGWDPDPWMPLFFVVILFASVFFVEFAGVLRGRLGRGGFSIVWGGLFMLFSLTGFKQDLLADYTAVKNHRLSYDAARRVVKASPCRSAVVTEPSWFIVKLLTYIEGYRDDLLPVYLPEIYFPELFAPLYLKNSKGEIYSSLQQEKSKVYQAGNSALNRLKRFLDFTAPETVIQVEPVLTLSKYIAPLAQLRDDGTVLLLFGQPGFRDKHFIEAKKDELRQLQESIDHERAILQSDAGNYRDHLASNAADLLLQSGLKKEAVEVLQSACRLDAGGRCSGIVVNNITAYLIDMGEFSKAAWWACRALQGRKGMPEALKQNVQIALPYLGRREVLAIRKTCGAELE